MLLPTTVKLSSIYCRDEADGIGDAEPYLWTIFFKIDGETIKHTPNTLTLTGDAVFHFGPGSHGNLGTESVNAATPCRFPLGSASFTPSCSRTSSPRAAPRFPFPASSARSPC